MQILTIKEQGVKPPIIEFAHKIAWHSSDFLVSSGGVRCIPKTAKWSLMKCIEWLHDDPLTDKQNIAFVRKEV
jgi:hypothetical protein